ncbi:MAG: GrpB-like predicted nucleotidyltransferase (UPF0157 family) [Limisphaerales bacterium]
MDYDLQWPLEFQKISSYISSRISGLIMEHVGSTSVPGLCAKPFIEIDLIVDTEKEKPAIIEQICKLGYANIGD